MFYKMALKIYFHKYFQCSLVDDKNTKLSFIIYGIDLKTCFCTVEIETALFQSRAKDTLKLPSIVIQCELPDDGSPRSPLLSALLHVKNSSTLKD